MDRGASAATLKNENNMKITCEINADDWTSGHDDRDRCAEALEKWFNGLTEKTRLAIYYAQQHQWDSDGFDPWNDNCPWLAMVFAAEDRAIQRHAGWVRSEHGPATGFNMSLYAKLSNK